MTVPGSTTHTDGPCVSAKAGCRRLCCSYSCCWRGFGLAAVGWGGAQAFGQQRARVLVWKSRATAGAREGQEVRCRRLALPFEGGGRVKAAPTETTDRGRIKRKCITPPYCCCPAFQNGLLWWGSRRGRGHWRCISPRAQVKRRRARTSSCSRLEGERSACTVTTGVIAHTLDRLSNLDYSATR